MMETRKILTLCCVIVISCALSFNSAHAVLNIRRNGYIEQIVKDGGIEIRNYLVTNWELLQPRPDTSEREHDIFLCLIAAQMLDLNMTWEYYFEILKEKGISYELQELQGPWTVGGDEELCLLNFSSEVSLFLIDNPVQYAVITVDAPFQYGGSASIPVDLELTMTPYSTLTEEGQLVYEP